MQFTVDGSREASPSEASSLRHNARRIAYTLAAGAAASGSDAEVVHFAGDGIVINPGFSQNLDIDVDGNNDLLLKNYVFFGGNYQGATVSFAPGRIVAIKPMLIGNRSHPVLELLFAHEGIWATPWRWRMRFQKS